jgi:3-methylcrotonyl-CoA carboxylase alpha subunit
MHGRIVKVMIATGDRVEKGRALVVLEGMKMEHWICAAQPGTVTELRACVGAQCAAGERLLVIDSSPRTDGAATGLPP